MEPDSLYITCPCEVESPHCFKSPTVDEYQMCLTCGRVKTHKELIAAVLPKLYQDLMMDDENPDYKWVPNFYQDENNALFLEAEVGSEPQWVLLRQGKEKRVFPLLDYFNVVLELQKDAEADGN